jgi:16S rRNA (adenine1518-N6/adenine1519-N6)-dimethyltransferase
MRILPKKSLGQNFLVDKNIRSKIIAACGFRPEDTVLEIGSGKGEMTAGIAERCLRIHALELDSRLHPLLRDTLRPFKNVRLIRRDVLKFDFNRSLKENRIKVFGNVPYYISTPIIERLIKYRKKISAVYITVQKEFALRITASPGSKQYGSSSCYVQYYFRPRMLFTIGRGSFFPVPKVDSALLELIPHTKTPFAAIDEKGFFRIIRAAFSQRRKTLRNSLSGLIPEGRLEAFFLRNGLSRDVRPEDLGLADFFDLCFPEKIRKKP